MWLGVYVFQVCLVTELLTGGQLLDSVMKRENYSETDAREVFRQLLEGIHYLHNNGIVHRDIKLENLILVNKGDLTTIQIADFGMAQDQVRVIKKQNKEAPSISKIKK